MPSASAAPAPLPSSSQSTASSAPAPAMPARSGPLDEVRRRLELLTLIRLGVATGLLILTLLLDTFGGAGQRLTTRVLMIVVVGIYAATLGYAVALSRWSSVRGLAVIQIGLDLAAWTAIVAATGGPVSPMGFFFALSTLTAALVLGERAARTTAVAAIAMYGTLAVIMTPGALSFIPGMAAKVRSAPPETTFQIVITIVATLIVAALGGSLASRLTRTGGALARAEASRAALLALYEDVVRSIPVALLTCDRTGVIDGANPGAEHLFGASGAQLLGTRVDRWLPMLDAHRFAESVPPRSGDATLERGGTAVPIGYDAATLYDRDGRARGGLVIIEDRTAVESMRETVQRSERLAVLGRLAAGLAHEIRNPLGAISGCVELVREGSALTTEDGELLATVQREVARLNDLVSDMLVFARPRLPERSRTDLSALARDVCRLANASGSRATVDFAEPKSGAVYADVDAAQIRQVLWNLVRNAIQASPANATVHVEVRALDEESSSELGCEIYVRDRGHGIPEDQLAKLFELFYSEKTRGTGLGLAIVKQIIDAHGGAVDVRSRSGGGTEFIVRLRRAD